MNKNQSVVNAFLPIMFKASGQARCPIAISSFPPAIGRGVRLTACKDIQNLPNCQTIREIFCDYSWVLLSPMFIFPFLPSIFILSRYACSTDERVFTWYLRYSRDCNDKKTPSVTCHMEIFSIFCFWARISIYILIYINKLINIIRYAGYYNGKWDVTCKYQCSL